MPFFPREARTTTSQLPVASTSSRPSPTARHVRKNSKVTQILRIVGTPEAARGGSNVANTLPNSGGVMSPPILPIDFDPFSGRPLGAVIVGDALPLSQVQAVQAPHLATQHVHKPALSMSSVPVPAQHLTNHAHTRHTSASQSTNGASPATVAQRASRPQLRTDHAKAGTLSARSRGHPPPSSSVPGNHTTTPSQPPLNPSRIVNPESTGQHKSIFTHARNPEDAFAPHVRGTTITPHKHYQDTSKSAPKQDLHLRKARSSVILSNAPPPLHAPKPVNLLQRPSAETLHMLAESANRRPSHSNVQIAVATGNALWPPAPVVPPLRTVMPSREEQVAYGAAAHEVDKLYRKIGHERALIERIRADHDREVRRAERDAERQRSRHHRRAATENPRRGEREVEYRSLADYGYFSGGQQWAGAAAQ
jgi:hypothetical protein